MSEERVTRDYTSGEHISAKIRRKEEDEKMRKVKRIRAGIAFAICFAITAIAVVGISAELTAENGILFGFSLVGTCASLFAYLGVEEE